MTFLPRVGEMKVAVVPYDSGGKTETWYVVFVKDEEAWRKFKAVARRVKLFKRRLTLKRYGHVEYFYKILPQRPEAEPPLFFESVEAFEKWLRERSEEVLKTEEARRNVFERLREVLKEAEVSEPRRATRYRAVKFKAFSFGKLPPSYVGIARRGRLLSRARFTGEYYEVAIYEFRPSHMVWIRDYGSGEDSFLFLKKDADLGDVVEEMAQMGERELQDLVWALELAVRLLKLEEEDEELEELRERLAVLISAAKLLFSS